MSYIKNIHNTILLFIPFLIISCSKYEDGPVVSLRDREERVANEWIIDKATTDNRDITEQFERYDVYLSDDGDVEIDVEFTLFGEEYKSNSDGTWEFTNNQENIHLDMEDDDYDATFQILRLTENQLFLRQVGEDLELELEDK